MEKKTFVRAFLLGILLTPVVLHGLETIELDVDVRLTWDASHRAPAAPCFILRVPEPGHILIELSTTAPSTAPGILVLAPQGEGEAPSPVHRIESTVMKVNRAGDHPVCLTSQAPLGQTQVLISHVRDEPLTKERDKEEIELEPDPEP